MNKIRKAMKHTTAAVIVSLSFHAGSVQGQEPADFVGSGKETDSNAGAAPITNEAAAAPAPVKEPQQEAKRGNRLIEEIVVTAQKREENLQDVPISIQAFSADALDAKGIEEPKALQLSTPGLQYNTFAGYSLIYIRGVGTDAFIPSADASVATYIDGIYYPFGHSLASALGAIERVEILKGPQGTLFGRNSTGGAINIITKQPGPDLKSNILVSRESDDKTNVRIYVNIPLHDTFAVSVSGLSYTEESYYKLAAASPRVSLPDETSRAFSAKAGWTPIDDLKATLGYAYINTRGAQTMFLPAHDIKPLGMATGVTEQPDYITGEDVPTYIDTVSRVITGDIKYFTPWFDLRLMGGDQEIISPALADYDGSSEPLTSFEALGQFADVRTGEFQILSNEDSWGAEWLQWIGGAYYIDSSAGYDPLLFTGGPGFLTALAAGNPDSPLISSLGGISAGTGIPVISLINGGVNLNLQGVVDTRSTAYFVQATADITDWMALTLGGRYQTEKRTLAKSTMRYVPDPNQPYNVVPVFDFNTPTFGHNGPPSRRSSNFSPKLVLDFKPWDDQLFFLSYAKGFKSGTYNIIAISRPTQFIVPEQVTTYEIGYKITLLDGAMRFNAAVFQNTIDNLQVQVISLTSGGSTRFETAGSAEIKGAEFDLLWQLFPDILPGLVFNAGGALLDGKYTDYKNGSGYDETTGVFFDGTTFPSRDFTGNRVVRTPRFSGNSGLSYTFELESGSLELSSDIYYNSGSYFSAQNTASSKQDAYHVINARIGYLYEPWNLRLTAFGKNINNGKYNYVIQDLDFGTAKLLAQPATYGVKLQWEFQ